MGGSLFSKISFDSACGQYNTNFLKLSRTITYSNKYIATISVKNHPSFFNKFDKNSTRMLKNMLRLKSSEKTLEYMIKRTELKTKLQESKNKLKESKSRKNKNNKNLLNINNGN